MITLNTIENIHLWSNAWMVVVIWFVQWVHYPLFKYIEQKKLSKFSKDHQTKISLIVMPAMLLELTSLSFLTFNDLNPKNTIACLLLVIIWLSTWTLQVPIHQKLLVDPQKKDIPKLIQTNWIRTLAWTLKLFLLILVQ